MKKLWVKWKELAEKIGSFQASLIFSLFYYILVVPVGIIVNFFSDFLGIRQMPKWTKSDIEIETLENLEEQS